MHFESSDEVFAVVREVGRYGPLVVFACTTGLRPEARRCSVRRSSAGVERRTLYQMRHMFATLALAADMPIDFV